MKKEKTVNEICDTWRVGQPTNKGIITDVSKIYYVEINWNWYDTRMHYIIPINKK